MAGDTWWVALQRLDCAAWPPARRHRVVRLFGDQPGDCGVVDYRGRASRCSAPASAGLSAFWCHRYRVRARQRERGNRSSKTGNVIQRAFADAVQQVCLAEALPLYRHPHTAPDQLPQLVTWLRTSPHPLALCCFADGQAAWLHRLCREHGLRIPDQIALIGLGDVPERCLAFDPALSSVALPWEFIGLLVARHMHVRISGGQVPAPEAIRPFRVAARASTRARLSTDPLVRKAQHWLQNNLAATQPLRAIAQHRGCLMQTLCLRFRQELTTPKQVHDRLRCQQASTLLEESSLPIASIAAQVGFTSPTSFGIAFKRRFGCSPRQWRNGKL